MFSKFQSLSEEKQDRILNAAIKEFAYKGYQKASTNEIVKEAEISKGLLFHYFNNKKDMYLFLYSHFMDLSMKQILEKIDWTNKDLFKRYKNIGFLKFELFQKYPEMFNFLKSVFKEDAPEVKSDIDKKNKQLIDSGYKDMFGDIDVTMFKDGLDIEKTLNIIFWSLEGFAHKQQDKAIAAEFNQAFLDELMNEMEAYLDILREAFYK
ncbi:TetR/AcrR family transcriptional regulator [Bacillus marasmi]|uniref:TetR/AcrR family transcriptional regulator n=1 Tax=Bacillus marasmi TaxID=1926279 RepID=UPI0011C737C3|nr:TetR/AcrR family transcriptional regulator [Bacillus marasmi]